MPFLVIRGTFHVVGYEPDGDSIRFQADHDRRWLDLDAMSIDLAGHRVNLNARGHAQLRFEGIDALETHYQGKHQPLQYAEAARTRLLKFLGIANVQMGLDGAVTSADDGTRGYILSRASDRYHRPIAFVYAGDPPESDGDEVRLTVTRLRDSANHKLVAEGLAYPTYYTGLFYDLRNELTRVTRSARNANRRLWKVDETTTGATVTDLDSIENHEVIMPKLFRRLSEFLEGGGTVAGFVQHLAINREKVLIISQNHFTHFDTVVDVQGDTVKMMVPPEDLIFFE